MKVFGISIPLPPWPGAGDRPPGSRRMTQGRRRILAALVLGCAVALIAWILVPESPAGASVVVAAKAIPAGQRLADGDVRIESYPERLAPRDRVESPADLVGHTAAHQLAPGVPVTRDAIMTPDAAKLARGHVLVPVSIPDSAAAAVLEPGHRIRVYASAELADDPTSDSRTLVSEAVVTAVRKPTSGALTGETATVVTLSVPEKSAAALAGVASGGLGFALLN